MIESIDHIVLTVRSLEATCRFYERLGFIRKDVPGQPTALSLGHQKINVHELGHTFEPKAAAPTPGAGDFCLITRRSIDAVAAYLAAHKLMVETGPVERNGARGPMTSLYLRDPDGNLVEISRYFEDV